MSITVGEGEGALATFAAAFLGYVITVAEITSQVALHAAIVGGIAALGYLGYNVMAGNVQSSSSGAPQA